MAPSHLGLGNDFDTHHLNGHQHSLHSLNHIAYITCFKITIHSRSYAINLNHTIIIAYSIATFDDCTLHKPVKMHCYESRLSATSYDNN